MSNIDNQEVQAVSKTNALVEAITLIANNASSQDKETYASMIGRSSEGTEIIDLSPGLAALIFIESNKRNRDWKPAKTESYKRQIEGGQWKLNQQGLAFYKDGKLADGQHRSSACALSGKTIRTTVFYGLDKEAVATIDCGSKRNASDTLSLDGIENSKLIEAIVRTANQYEIKAKVDGVKKLESNLEVLSVCQSDMDLIQKSIAIGNGSIRGVSQPTLSTSEAAKVTYLFIKNGWDEKEVSDRLALFQLGQDESEASPMFRVATKINQARLKKTSTDRLAAMSQIGLVIHAFKLTHKGIKAIQPSSLQKVATGKETPDPRPEVLV
jgi:hypothetical protein